MRGALEGSLNGEGPSVKFHGHVARETVLAALATARAAVFPSYAEAFAMAPAGSHGARLPHHLLARAAAARRLIRDGVDGLLVDPADPNRIAGAIVRLLADDELAARLGEAGRQRVRRSVFVRRSAANVTWRGTKRAWNDFERINGAARVALAARGERRSGRLHADCADLPAAGRGAGAAGRAGRAAGRPGGSRGGGRLAARPHGPRGVGVGRRRRLPFDLVYARAPRGLTRQRNAGIDLSTRPVRLLPGRRRHARSPATFWRSCAPSRAAGSWAAVGGAIVNQMDRPIPRRWRIRLRAGPGAAGRAGHVSSVRHLHPARSAEAVFRAEAKWMSCPAARSPSGARCWTTAGSRSSSPATRRAKTWRCPCGWAGAGKLACCGEARVVAP